MPVERSAGAVIFRKTQSGKEYLLLQHPDKESRRVIKPTAGLNASRRPTSKAGLGHWDFPKGHLEKREETLDAVRREVKEETGLTRLHIIPGFKVTIRYFVNYDNQKRLKFVAFFLAETRQKKVTISWEHQDFAWLPFEEACERLTYANAKKVLTSAHHFISRKDL